MASVTIKLVSPSGVPLDLHVSPDDEGPAVQDLLQRTDRLGAWLRGNGWGFAETEPAGPTARELAAGPTFAGYPCSPTVDDAGLPTWIMVNEKQAMRREKQGDVWYSYKDGDEYVQVLRIPKGEKAPAIQGLPGQSE